MTQPTPPPTRSRSPAQFEMAPLILLGQDEQALRLLDGLMADGSVTPADLATRPLFDRFPLTTLGQ